MASVLRMLITAPSRSQIPRRKANIGGKGVGRFLWLKAFEMAQIDSIFQDENDKWKQRHFEFRLTPTGLENLSLDNAQQNIRSTVVKLLNLRPAFQKYVPRSAKVIANRIVEHCLEHFVLGLAPQMILIDGDTAEKIDIGELYRADVKAQTQSKSLQVAGHKFNLHNLRVRLTYDNAHRLYFCANKRAVVSKNLKVALPISWVPSEMRRVRHFFMQDMFQETISMKW